MYLKDYFIIKYVKYIYTGIFSFFLVILNNPYLLNEQSFHFNHEKALLNKIAIILYYFVKVISLKIYQLSKLIVHYYRKGQV